jgi:hypothetical protein
MKICHQSEGESDAVPQTKTVGDSAVNPIVSVAFPNSARKAAQSILAVRKVPLGKFDLLEVESIDLIDHSSG